MTEDVTLTHELIVSGITASICLNGHTIDLGGKAIYLESGATLTIYDCDANATTGKITGGGGHYASSQKGGAVYVKGSTLNLYGGSLESNRADWGGAIFIDATSGNSTVNMYGGVIQNNTARYGGGGIEVENVQSPSSLGDSIFKMYGGSIINNQVTETNGNAHKGGGVHFNQASMTINGTVNITGNKVAGVENNVYLRTGKTITIESIGEGSRIGVSAFEVEKNQKDTIITAGYNRPGISDIKCFFLDETHDKSNYALIHNGSELQIKKHNHDWKYRQDESGNKLYAYCATDDSHCEYYGADCAALPLTITAQSPVTYSGSAYDGAELRADELSAFQTATNVTPSIVYYKDESLTQKTTTADGASADGAAPVNAGTYYAAVSVNNVTAKTKFTIDKAPVSVTPPTGLTMKFTGAAQELVTAGSVNHSSATTSAGTMEYQVVAGDMAPNDLSWTDTIPTKEAAGTYRVYYRAVVDGNHTPVDYTNGYPYVTAEITKAAPTYTEPSAASPLTYTGAPQRLITAGTTAHGTFRYSLDGTDWKTDAAEITGTNAGDYNVYWKLMGDESHEDVQLQTPVRVTIQKAEPTQGNATDCIIMEGNPLSSNVEFAGYTMKGVDGNELPGTFAWKDGTIVPTTDGTQTAVFTPSDTTNYKEVEVQAKVKIYHLPSGKITVETSSWDKLLTSISFGIYHPTTKEVKIEGTANSQGGYAVDRIYYYIDTTGSTTVLSAEALKDKWKEYQDSNRPKVAADSKNVIYAKITDERGNAAIICSNGIVIDGQPPIAAVTINENAYKTTDNGTMKGSAKLSITITDQGAAGLQSATAVYQKTGESSGTNISLADGAGTADITTPGTYTLTLNAKDKAGNTMTAQVYAFTVVEARTITLTKATAKDAVTGQKGTGYLQGDKVILTADAPEEGYAFDHWNVSGITLDAGQEKKAEITITMPDNDITVEAVYKDVAAPVISGIKNGGKYCGSAAFTVTDNAALATVTLDGTAVTPAGGKHTIPADGGTHIVKAVDAAGNVTEYTVTVYKEHDFSNPVYKETGRSGNEITEEAPCGHGCGKTITRKKTTQGDIISQEYPNSSGNTGSLATKVEVDSATPATSVKGLDIEVADKLLTDAERSQVYNGENLLVYLKVNKLEGSAVPVNDKALTEVEAAKNSGLKEGIYLDLSIWKQIGSGAPTPVTNAETAEKLTITVTLPETLKAPAGKVRTYCVIRVHSGTVTWLPAQLDGDQISFTTDRFSTYSIWYTEKDAPASSGGGGTPGHSGSTDSADARDNAGGQNNAGSQDNAGGSNSLNSQGSQDTSNGQNSAVPSGNGNDSGNGSTGTPKTGDESNMALWIMLLLLSAVTLTGITAGRKKDRG